MHDTALADTEVTGLFAELAGAERPLAPAEAAYVRWALEHVDPASGQRPAAEENPHHAAVGAALAACEEAATRWWTQRDGTLWLALAALLHRRDPAHATQAALLALCRRVRCRTRADRAAIRAYLGIWSAESRARLLRKLATVGTLAEACEFMSTYKPKGLITVPPFAVGAEAVLEVLAGPAGAVSA